MALSAVLFFAAILTVVTIFQFKNRKMQIKMSSFILGLLTISLALVFFRAGDIPEDLVGESVPVVEYGYGGLMLLIPALLTFLAMRSVKKDEDLVKSMDRLR
jgi:hypothetical protein